MNTGLLKIGQVVRRDGQKARFNDSEFLSSFIGFVSKNASSSITAD